MNAPAQMDMQEFFARKNSLSVKEYLVFAKMVALVYQIKVLMATTVHVYLDLKESIVLSTEQSVNLRTTSVRTEGNV